MHQREREREREGAAEERRRRSCKRVFPLLSHCLSGASYNIYSDGPFRLCDSLLFLSRSRSLFSLLDLTDWGTRRSRESHHFSPPQSLAYPRAFIAYYTCVCVCVYTSSTCIYTYVYAYDKRSYFRGEFSLALVVLCGAETNGLSSRAAGAEPRPDAFPRRILPADDYCNDLAYLR